MRWAKACVIDNRSFASFATASLNPSNRSIGCRFGPVVNQGARASLCKPCLDKSGPIWLEEIPVFREQNCEHCGRPVLTPSRWKLRRAICIQRNAAPHWRRRVLNNFGPCADRNVECPRYSRKFTPKRIDRRFCSVTCKQAAYSKRDRSIKQYHITH